ncbi:hypothetical protein GLOIN_2v1695250 [Rhizophagus clarus]|uniref:Uncharacterized protein n=1 Tax=Rhizophagus clarus TaxID=94130 RepID=A0A8H3QR83_9GLOM|nr:hypothetical protein GLOIN_2v1695250 [Rhizophagus clarus]
MVFPSRSTCEKQDIKHVGVCGSSANFPQNHSCKNNAKKRKGRWPPILKLTKVGDLFTKLEEKKITGDSFLKLSGWDFKEYGMSMRQALELEDYIKELYARKRVDLSDYLASKNNYLSEVLAKYGLDSDGIDSIPLFSPPTYEIQDDNKVFKRCMEEILGRLRSYGTLQPDSLEAMRNEYVVALLHASIHIVMDITNKELSMKPQYGIVGEESRGRVDYAIKEAEELICITEDKQHKVPIGFAQNIKQLESACETNKKKRKRGDNDFDYLYGIVTTGRDWHFLLYSPGKISKASDTANLIEFSRKALEPNSKSYQSLCDSVKERISELEAENVKIKADYETEIAVLKDENTKLRHIIEENARRDVRVEKLENRVAVMEQGSLVVGDQQQNDREVTPEVSAVDLPTTLQKSQLDSTDTKTSEEKEMDAFLDDAHKKKVSDEIRQHNREKKLLHESANQEISPNISSVKTVTDHDDRCSSENSGKNGNSVTNRDDRQKIIPVTADDDDDDDDVTELSKNQNIEQELTKELLSGSITIPSLSSETTKHPSSSLGTTQSLVHLFQNAIRAGHEEILSWLYYSNSFENKVDEIRCDTGVSDKMVRSRLYKEMLEHLPGITSGNLRMKTLRAKKIRMLFGEGGLGIDKVKKVTLSVYAISSLTISQIQSIIKNVTSVELSPDCNHVTSVTNRDDQTNTTEARSHDRSYFRNKTLDQYPTLYREYSSEDFDYYGITDKTLCPLCKLGHDDEESIEGLIYVNYTYYNLN